MGTLEHTVAVVAGATRGAGRGIARMLGEAGATVYCTGRSSRAALRDGARPETVEETAELVTAAGGRGIAVRVDHAVEGEVRDLFRRVDQEAGRVDLLVNVLGGAQPAWGTPFWEGDAAAGRALFDGWLWPHLLTTRHAAPLMVARGAGLVVEVGESPTLAYLGELHWDLARVALARLSFAAARELAPHGVASLVVAPGFMRTEVVLETFGATEADWREVAERSEEARRFGLAGSETPHFVGRAVAALAADPDVLRRSGGVFSTWELAEAYGFDDVDGGRPDWGRFFRETFGTVYAEPDGAVRWEIRQEAGAG